MSILHAIDTTPKYFPTFYSNGTQKKLSEQSKEFSEFVHRMFGKYCTELERELYRRGKRPQLPCDIPKEQKIYRKYHNKKIVKKIYDALEDHDNLTVKDICYFTDVPTKNISSILFHAVKRGTITKDYIPSKTRRKDVCVYNLVENSNE